MGVACALLALALDGVLASVFEVYFCGVVSMACNIFVKLLLLLFLWVCVRFKCVYGYDKAQSCFNV